jgi:hypothetical protein
VVTGTVTPGTTGATFAAGYYAYFASIFFATVLYPGFGNQACITLNTGGMTLRKTWPWLNAGFIPHTKLPIGACAVLGLRTGTAGRAGIGIYRIHAMADTCWDGEYVSSTFPITYANIIAYFTTPHTLYGLTLTPCVWSRVHNTFLPITEVRVMNKISRLSKRRPQKTKAYPWKSLADTW